MPSPKTQKHNSVMNHQFSRVPKAEIQRSSFDRSSSLKTTFDSGFLVPIFVDEVLPGDSFNLNFNSFSRLATPLKPIMDNLFMDTFFFFVPNRLLWENWEKFNGAQTNPGDSIDFSVPTVAVTPGVSQTGSIYDYMGWPVNQPIGSITGNSLHLRAYNLIWNEWFRDQNLQDSLAVPTGDGPDGPSQFTLQRRGKRHDYFSSALPFPQKGDPVSLPLGISAPVVSSGTGIPTFDGASSGTGALVGGGTGAQVESDADGIMSWNTTSLETDLSTATAATINQLREAFQVQRLLERDARGGTRYTEIIKSHFGVTSPDSRLQRPELLSQSSNPINITPIAQTSAISTQPTPQGNLTAVGISQTRSGFTKSFTEHGVIIGLVSVRADLTYQQGLNRMWSRQTRYDFYFPALAHLGEQEILNQEIFYDADDLPQNALVFGFQERYAEYRYKPSQITGHFRSSEPTSLDFWHLSQDFASLPLLNSDFIEDNPPVSRIVAVPSEPEFLFDGYFSLRCARPMPLYGVPGLIDHF